MPARTLREEHIECAKVNCLSVWAENFYIRLMLIADDYGRFEGRLRILKAYCYKLKSDLEVPEEDLATWIDELVKNKLVKFYLVNEFPYIQILDFKQRMRLSNSLYPNPEGKNVKDVLAIDLLVRPKERVEPVKPIQKEVKPVTPKPESMEEYGTRVLLWTKSFHDSEQIKLFREAYPAVDIIAELKKASLWLIANPEKRKKKFDSFFNRWCIKQQEKGGGSSSPQQGKKLNPL